MSKALRRSALPLLALVVVAAGSRAVLAAPAPAEPAPALQPAATPVSAGDRAVFVPVTQKRLLNTTTGARLATATPRAVKVVGVGGVPLEATAVVLTVAAYKPAKAGFLSVYPTGTTRPAGIATVNFVVGQITENVATVRVGTGGSVNVYATYTTHAIVDLVGYYVSHAHDDRYLPKAQAQGRSAADAFLCPAGSLIRSVAADGAPVCVQDATGPVTGVGAGLLLNEGVLSAAQGRSAADAFTCPAGQYLRAVAADGTPTCATDVDTDSDTTYAPGFGLLLDGNVFSAEQGRSATNAFTCPPGMYLNAVGADGTPTCEQDADTDTTYAAGFGLLLTNGVFSAQQGRTAANAFTCSIGQFLRAVAVDGTPTCAVDSDTGTTYTAGSGITIANGTISAHQSRSAANAFTCPAGQALRAVGPDGAPTCVALPSYTAGSGLLLSGTTFSAAHGSTVVPLRGDLDPVVNGTALRNAMNAITDATSTKPYVISLAPGTYNLGSSALTMKAYVSIIGAGRGISTITGSVMSQAGGLVNLGNNTTLARVTVSNASDTGASWVTAVWATGVTARVVEVDGTGSQAGSESFGMLLFSGAQVHAEDSRFVAVNTTGIGTGIYVISSALLRARAVEAALGGPAGYALHAYNSASIQFGEGYANGPVRKGTTNSELQVVNSRVDGTVSGGVQCSGNYSSAFTTVTCT